MRLLAIATLSVIFIPAAVIGWQVSSNCAAARRPSIAPMPDYERHMAALREADRRVAQAGGDDRNWRQWYDQALAELD